MKINKITKYLHIQWRRLAIILTALAGLGFGTQAYGSGGHGHHSGGHGLHHGGGFYHNGNPYPGYSYNVLGNGPNYFDSALYGVHGTYGKLNPGWRLMAKGNLHLAKEKFIKLSSKSPKSGLPLVGYSLSAVFSEDYDKAVKAMRYAFALDPVGASDLPSRPALRGKIRELALYYRDVVNRDENSDVDAVFMYAALSHLLNDFETAQTAIQVAIDLGDDSSSTENLKKLLV